MREGMWACKRVNKKQKKGYGHDDEPDAQSSAQAPMNEMMSSMNAKSMQTAQTIQSSKFVELSISDGDMVDSDDEVDSQNDDSQF